MVGRILEVDREAARGLRREYGVRVPDSILSARYAEHRRAAVRRIVGELRSVADEYVSGAMYYSGLGGGGRGNGAAAALRSVADDLEKREL